MFADADARHDLEAIVHPAVRRAIAAGLRAFELVGDSRLAVVDVPLLFETGREKDFDRVIVTTCPVELQKQRMLERGLSDDEARLRLAAQLPLADKVSRADYVIHTDRTFEETHRQVDEVLEKLNL